LNILAIDDNKLALEELVLAIKATCPADNVHGFSKPSELLEFAQSHDCRIAFLDIKMWGMSGLELAIALKKIKPTINIIFVTAYVRYKGEALDLRASGYILKPITKEAVEREIENLRHPVEIRTNKRVRVQTFGNFDVFVDGKPLMFSRSKSKELFAYLIDRRGASVTTGEIAAILWVNKTYNASVNSQVRVIISDMLKDFKRYNIEDIIAKSWNQIAVNGAKISCDYYDLLEWNPSAVNAFCGEYMSNYTWAEITSAELVRKMNVSAEPLK